MDGIDVVGGDLDILVGIPNGISIVEPQPTAGADLEGLLGNKGTILLDPSRREVYVNHDGELRIAHLRLAEFNLLEYLMRNAGRAVPHDEISREVFGHDPLDIDKQNNIRVYVNRLRRKIGQEHIQNIFGIGYKFIGNGKHATEDMPLGSKESLVLYPLSRVVYTNKEGKLIEVRLKRMEFNLLEYLMMNAGRVVTHDEISREVFGHDQYDKGSQDTINSRVNNLRDFRKKLGHEGIEHIQNIHGVGYKFIVAGRHAVGDVPLGSEDSVILYPLGMEVYVNRDGKPREVDLTRLEFNLLKYLMTHTGRIVPYDEISREVFGYDQYDKGPQNTIKSRVKNLRRKLGDNPDNPVYIANAVGEGYKFVGAQNNKVV